MAKIITKDMTVIMEEIKTLISEGKHVSLTAKGNSMNPFIVHLRDQITLAPWKDSDIRKGTVALVKDSRGHYLIHRIIHRDKDTITLLGDGNVGIKETAAVNDVIGVMVSVTRKGKTYPTDGFAWKAYSAIWTLLTPLRRLPLGVWRRLNRNKVFDFTRRG